jgi:phenylalanyl-tRNA synthetase alpha subunit
LIAALWASSSGVEARHGPRDGTDVCRVCRAHFPYPSPMHRASLTLALLLFLPGCDAISDIVGTMGAAKNVAAHLEEDVKAKLTNERIDKVVEVTPALREFSKEAKVKWTPDPNANDFSNLAQSLAGLNEYISFFESHDTRLTQFYVDFVKINDARSKIMFQRGKAEAKEKLQKDIKETKKKLEDAADAEKKKLEKKLERLKLTLEKMDQVDPAADEMKKANEKAGYKLSDEEIKLVEARIDELNALFDPKKGEDAKATPVQ